MSVDIVTAMNMMGSHYFIKSTNQWRWRQFIVHLSPSFLPLSCPSDQSLPCYSLIGWLYEGKRSNQVQSPHYINNEPSNSGIIHVSSTLWMGLNGYPKTSHLSFLTPCRDPKVLEHKDEKLWSFIFSSMWSGIIKFNWFAMVNSLAPEIFFF